MDVSPEPSTPFILAFCEGLFARLPSLIVMRRATLAKSTQRSPSIIDLSQYVQASEIVWGSLNAWTRFFGLKAIRLCRWPLCFAHAAAKF
jgi:hypothetical protein